MCAEFDRHRHDKRNRRAPLGGWGELPLLRRFDGGLVEPVPAIQRLHDLDIANRSIREHDGAKPDFTVDLLSQRLRGVLRVDALNDDRRADARTRRVLNALSKTM